MRITTLFSMLLLTCAFLLPSTSCEAQKFKFPVESATPKTWTAADAKHYAERQNDSSTWEMRLFEMDMEHVNQSSSHQGGINAIPSPVPKYYWGFASSQTLEIKLPGKRVVGYNIAYAYDEYRPRPDSSVFYLTQANLLFLTDAPEEEIGTCSLVSRNYPHYLSTGMVPTSKGNIEWVQMHMATGDSFVIIAQRYFDLNQGKTIIVAPQKDGSLRFLQLKDSPGPVIQGGFSNPVNTQRKEDFLQRLANNPLVENFLLSEESL